ncbi:EAL domain-containing protein [Mycolicibacterium sp. 3033]|nr:EAL domain-containing protein [Mycolicibacterium aurantiacum]
MAYSLAIVAGRATRLAGGEISLVWPAAAVATIWLLAIQPCSWKQRLPHVALLVALTFAVNLATGAAVPLAAWFVLVNVVLAAVTVAVLTRGGRVPTLRDPVDLARLVAAVIVGASSAAVLAAGYFGLVEGHPFGETFALFAVRNGASILLGVAIWLRAQETTWGRPGFTVAGLPEAIAVTATAVVTFAYAFWLNTGVPIAFIVLVPAVWVALRYSTTVATAFLFVAGAWIVGATLWQRGALIVPDSAMRALLAQAMVCTLTIVVLTLSLYRDSRARLIAELSSARDAADRTSELLGAVLDSIHDSVVLTDADGDVVLKNSRAVSSGHIDDVAQAVRQAGTAVARKRDLVVEEQNRVIELTTAPLARRSAFTVAAFRDVTEERQHAEQLRAAHDLFAGVLEAAYEQAIVGTDAAGRITVFNNGAERLLGWSAEEVIGRSPMLFHDLSEVQERAAELGVAAVQDVFLRHLTPQTADVREWTYVRRDGSRVPVSVAISQMTDRNGACVGYIGVATDITERKAVEAELTYLASHDPLTGLANRALFMARVESALTAAGGGVSGVGLIFLDLDGFKTVNDTWGHACGDEVLKSVADRLTSLVGPEDTAARLGGDEFAVLCPQVRDAMTLRDVAERIRVELRRPVSVGTGRSYDQLSVSAGVAIAESGCGGETLLQRADNLMYSAKRNGKDCVAISGDPPATAARESQLRCELPRALDRDEFTVHFQPIVNLASAKAVAAEALLRWRHPDRGLLLPGAFLTVAEASAQMPAIGRRVLDEACADAATWTGCWSGAAVHVNVSGRQVERGDVRSDVLAALEASGLDPRRLVLELTETHAGRPARSLADDLESLRELGVQIAIDDVGTGFNGLQKMVDYPFDIIKISRQFIAGMLDDKRYAMFTRAIVELGSRVGMTVIAEGIERPEQRDRLLEWGCTRGQGFLFGRARSDIDGIKPTAMLFDPA